METNTNTETATQTEEGLVYFNGVETFTLTGKRDRKATHIVTNDNDGTRLIMSCNGSKKLAEKALAQAAGYGRTGLRIVTIK